MSASSSAIAKLVKPETPREVLGRTVRAVEGRAELERECLTPSFGRGGARELLKADIGVFSSNGMVVDENRPGTVCDG